MPLYIHRIVWKNHKGSPKQGLFDAIDMYTEDKIDVMLGPATSGGM